jgi:hypothetical protein
MKTNVNDRELLVLSAKAVGINLVVEEIPHRTNGYGMETVFRIDGHPCRNWNPLTDDGDAMRLAVKLGVIVGMYAHYSTVDFLFPNERIETITVWHSKADGGSCASTRRAITRAAAEIGKASHEEASS